MTEIDIGGRAEEMLRDYFLESNCYVARGIKLRFGGTDVTDIDLWLYSRPSSFSRERTNVDAKYKQKPQAMERILWAKGVQAIIGTERCIVATTDKRPVVKSYAHEHGVVVLDGHFLSRLVRRASSEPSRWIEDDLLDALADKSDKTLMDWKVRASDAKARLVTDLNFDGCNLWLDDIGVFLKGSVASEHRSLAYRLSYLTISYFLVGLDFRSMTLAFEDANIRKRAIEDGLRYGEAGKEGVNERLRMAEGLISQYGGRERASSGMSRRALQDIQALPVDGLAEFFSKIDVTSDLFMMAKELESAAYKTKVPEPGMLSAKAQGALGVMLDFCGLDRTEFYERAETHSGRTPMTLDEAQRWLKSMGGRYQVERAADGFDAVTVSVTSPRSATISRIALLDREIQGGDRDRRIEAYVVALADELRSVLER